MKMGKHLRHKSCLPSKLSKRSQGNLTFTVLCLIALGSGIAALSFKNYQYKRYWQRTHRNYFDEKQVQEFCFAAFKKLKEAATKAAVITYESDGELHFIDAITKEDLVNLVEISFGDSVKISIFSNPNGQHHIPCLSKEEGMRQTLEDFFQQEILPSALEEEKPFKDNYLRIRERWFSLKNSTDLDAKLFEPYLKAYSKSGTQLLLTFLNPFDRRLIGNYDLALTVGITSGSIDKTSEFICSLKPAESILHTIEMEKAISKFNLHYGNVFIEKILKTTTTTKPASGSKWRKKAEPSSIPEVRLVEIVNKVYFKTQTPLQRLNASLFFHESLEPVVAFGKKDAINKYYWNTIVLDKSVTYFNLNANPTQLKQQLESLFEESVAERLYEDILEKQPFYNVYSFSSELSQDLAKHWNALDNPPIFVLREESFIIEVQFQNPHKNASMQYRLWVYREAKSDKEREWNIAQIEYKRF